MGISSRFANFSKAILSAALVSAQSAAACEPELFTGGSGSYDKRISIKPDCSFKDTYVDRYRGSADFTVDTRSGGPARNIGNGRVAQKILQSQACGPSEMLLFVDCNTADAVMIRGAYAPDDESGLSGDFIKYIQAPYGPIKIGENSTVAGLIATAHENDFYVIKDAKVFLAGERKRDRYDFACGCKLYYPGSVAAGG